MIRPSNTVLGAWKKCVGLLQDSISYLGVGYGATSLGDVKPYFLLAPSTPYSNMP